jgi:hypothetical protein
LDLKCARSVAMKNVSLFVIALMVGSQCLELGLELGT